jgi:spore coat polysaccharide biosynthesis protein SpsF (cytidylyltransferase family)
LKTIAIIQARMSSTRLPGKIMMELCGMPMINVLLQRISLAKEIDSIVVATTDSSTDDVLVDWLKKNNVLYFRGSENDVLERYWKCAKSFNAKTIVRITSDDPFKDPSIIDKAVLTFNTSDVDYVSNTISPTYPEGLDVEVFSFSALTKAFQQASFTSDREHVTPYIWRNPQIFKTINFKMNPNLRGWRWTIDKVEDLEFARAVFLALENNIFINYLEIIKMLKKNPKLLKINKGTKRNEGYIKSLKYDKLNYE